MKRLKKVAILITVIFIIIGCESTKQALQRDEVKGGLIGGALGAGAGAIIGSQSGNAGVGTAIGAGVGAVTGAVIGRAMQKQKEELQQVAEKINKQQAEIDQLKSQQATVKTEGNSIVMNLRGDALFRTNSSSLESGAVNNLREIVEVLKKYPDTRVIVKGFTDSEGDEDYNLKLSQARAETVKNYFIGEGISPSRITAIGLGESLPIASNDTPEGRQMNRRVEIVVIPAEGE
ncbi:MAG: hypothetical protein D6734_11740 [Candidatus Schekmanbacteria bacterium]|nr:MAG: hypothetical protein D6734_11740 [Candidatus Schekmanbacteria bacterium]